MNASILPLRQSAPALSRNAAIALAVVVLHVGFIWALQSGLLMRAAELIVPAQVLSQFVDPPSPKVSPTPPLAPAPVKRAVAKTPVQTAPQPLAVADNTAAANAPVAVATPQAAPAAVSAAPATPAVAPAAPAQIQLPSSNADYLQNPKPPYPALSRRMGEQGKTTLRVLIGTDGLPKQAEIVKSSGYERLDQAALATAMRWRYVPGKRGGVPEAMWFNVPINWVLE